MPTATLRALARFRWAATTSARTSKHPPRSATVAGLHTTRAVQIQDSMKDRTKIDRESNEYSKSATDDQAAGRNDAFKPNEGSPESKSQGQNQQGDSLNVSPANQEVSQPVEPEAGGAQHSGKENDAASGKGSPEKGKKIT